MGLYRRFICKLKTAIPLQKSSSLNTYYNSRRSRISEFFQPVLRNSVLQNVVKNNQHKSSFLDGFFHNLISRNRNFFRTYLLGNLVGCGIAYYWHLERVPYTKRSHFVIVSTSEEIKLRESKSFETFIESKFEGKKLLPLHPSSIRVQRIGKDLVEAAQKGFKKEEESLIIKIFKKLGKRDYHQIPQFEWEFFVLDDPQYFKICSHFGGKIVIPTGWLDTFESDAEIAVGIAHEVGHSIARHSIERLTRLPELAIFTLFLYWTTNRHIVPAISQFLERLDNFLRHSGKKAISLSPLILKAYFFCVIPAISRYLIWLPYHRRDELEADYIGLILMARAGYDPRVAPHVVEKIGSPSQLEDYVSSHPCGKTRAKKLSQPRVMEEALSMYREVQI